LFPNRERPSMGPYWGSRVASILPQNYPGELAVAANLLI